MLHLVNLQDCHCFAIYNIHEDDTRMADHYDLNELFIRRILEGELLFHKNQSYFEIDNSSLDNLVKTLFHPPYH